MFHTRSVSRKQWPLSGESGFLATVVFGGLRLFGSQWKILQEQLQCALTFLTSEVSPLGVKEVVIQRHGACMARGRGWGQVGVSGEALRSTEGKAARVG